MVSKPNTAPPKGTRDFLPADVRRREHVLSKVREVYRRYGFEPLETPAMERLEVLLGKYGEEGDQLIFRVMHRGEKLRELLGRPGVQENDLADMALRYDLTVPLARVVAEHQGELPKFFKRYQIQPVWRADRPARGRFREFYQCDVDVVGSESLVCEVEVASAVCEVLDALGFDDYRIRLNHRGVLRGLVEEAGIPLDKEVEAITALDKWDKIGPDAVANELHERGIAYEAAARFVDFASFQAKSPAEFRSDAGRRGSVELAELQSLARETPCGKRIEIDFTLARGLSYYTGPIFEVQVKDLAGSLGGGGRYDNLIGMFLGRPVPAVGFSLGLERILVVMEERKMFPPLEAPAQVMVFRIDEATTPETLRVASALRASGIATELYPNVDKLGKQFQYAESRKIPLVAFVGTRERDAGEVAFKVMATQKQEPGILADPALKARELLG